MTEGLFFTLNSCDYHLTKAMRAKLGEDFTLTDCYKNGGIFADKSLFDRSGRFGFYAFVKKDGLTYGAAWDTNKDGEEWKDIQMMEWLFKWKYGGFEPGKLNWSSI